MNRPFCCLLCAQNFRFQSHLRNHEAVCKGLSDYPQCDSSQKTFKSGKTLQIHQAKVHEVKLEERPFICLKCEKRFKLKNHLKNHAKICKGFKDYIKCNDCKKKFKSNESFKKHMKICKPAKRYNCNECESSFVSFKEITDHRLQKHKNVVCDICEKDIYFKNIKRHMKQIHAGQTPASYTRFIQQKQKEDVECFNCEQCSKSFQSKGNLNRHLKSHEIKCDKCEIIVYSVGDLQKHKLTHIQENENDSVFLGKTELKLVLEAHKLLENMMAMGTNRGQEMSFSELNKHCENRIKKNLGDTIFKVMISINPTAYYTYVEHGDIYLQLAKEGKCIRRPVTPKTLTERRQDFKQKILDSHKNDIMKIRLIYFPELQKKIYISAQDTIIKNIVKLDDEDEMGEEHKETFKTKYEEIENKIKKRMTKKLNREEKMKNIDWQKMRLPELARAINQIFVSENRNVIQLGQITSKLQSSSKLESDIQRLIDSSQGWLQNIRGWIKRRPENINFICDILK